MTSPRPAYVWMLLGAASFSVMSFVTHALRDAVSWQMIAVVRTAIALVLAVAMARAAGAQLVLMRPGTLWIRSIAGSVALLANFFSMTHYPISEVLALSNMFPLWVAVLSWPVLGERPKLDVWFAAGFGVAGVYLLQQSPPQHYNAPLGVLPVITAVTASLASAIALLGLHQVKGIDARAVVAHFSGVSLLFSAGALFAFPVGATGGSITAVAIALLVVVGLSGTAGQLFLTKAFASGPPAQVSVVGLSQVGFSMLLELAFPPHRPFSIRTLIGLSLVVAPTAWVLLRRSPAAPAAKKETVEEAVEPMSDV